MTSAVSCRQVDGQWQTAYGHMEFTLAEDLQSFDGLWPYCDEEPDRSWSGTLAE